MIMNVMRQTVSHGRTIGGLQQTTVIITRHQCLVPLTSTKYGDKT